ncbi:hypothetical protein M8J77_012900 [Diaphorina citri]|nr:hypothetical protein M8J77_012900 [Diaphorina citri]
MLRSAFDDRVNDASFWDPKTNEKDPDIPESAPLLLPQGIQCQRLGDASWNRIRYADAEKLLEGSNVPAPSNEPRV